MLAKQSIRFAYLLGIAIVCLFLFSYLNQLLYHYQVPPGGDAVNHNNVVHAILDGDRALIFKYHTVWHMMVILVSLVFQARTITVMAWLGPMLLVTCGLALYWFNRRFIGPVAGLASLILIGFFSFQPTQTLFDGGFPNVLAAGTVLPLFFISLNQIFSSQRKVLSLGLTLLLFIILAYSHHITTLYAVTVVFFAGLFIMMKRLRDRHISWLLIIGVMAFVIGVAPYVLRWILSLPLGSARDLASQFITITKHYPFISLPHHLDNPNAYWSLQVFPHGIGELIVYLGAAGFIVALFRLVTSRTRDEAWRTYLILVVWTVILTFGSQILALVFPVRLARDLAIPLALLGGVFVQTIYSYIVNRRLPKVFFFLFLLICLVIGANTFWERWQREVSPNSLLSHLSVDSQAADYITQNLPLDARIVGFYDDTYLPLFAPLHNVRFAQDPAFVQNISEHKNMEVVLQPIDYLYIERRFDRDSSSVNNGPLVTRYLESPYVTLEAVFEQPEKKVFLFKVKHPLPLETPKS
jgi:hypothetical protein